ncbi:MAG: efflux RND transporter permease subunit, partial [Muribaculaceae bacterium]|nr:efflux RND transporter permease subunit [Muribaculaceae bacterium]
RDKGRSRQEMVADLREKLSHLPGVNVEIGQPISHRIDAMLSGTEAQIAIKLFGPDLTVLNQLGNKIRAEVKEVEGVVDANIEQLMERPQLDIRPRRDMLAYYGIPMSEFSDFINVALAGETVSQVYEKGYPVNLVLRIESDARGSIESVRSLMIDSPKGKIPLSAVADVVSATGPNAVNRENVSRRIVVSANVEGRDLRSVVDEISDKVAEEVKLPEGYYVNYGGQFESEQSASRTLAIVSLVSLVIIFLLLYGQYHSGINAGIIMLNMPLALIGGVLILRITSGEMNIPAIIGFISLMGIATRNGMLLMSRYETLRQEGENLYDTILHGSSDRLNTILMTALSSAFALIPLAIGGDLPGN